MPSAMHGCAVRSSPARWALAALAAASLASAAPPDRRGPAAPADDHAAAGALAGPVAEQVYSNLQVLRGVPAEQILPAMELISASLGVSCEHCHVAPAFESDDKPAKGTAREMMRMVRALERDEFEGRRAVTCWSCHRGALRPATEPAPPAAEPVGPELEEASGVSAAEVFARHLEAVGGAEVARAVTGRVARGTATLYGGRELPVEIRQRAPGRYSMVLELAGGELVSALDGPAGVVETPGRPPRPMNGAEVAVARLANDFEWVARPQEVLSAPRVAGRRTLDGREAIVVEARIEGHPVELSFDLEDGLLRRVLAWVETPFGRLATRVDLGEYREIDGLLTPVSWTVARPQGAFTVHLTDFGEGSGS
jgi:hypothetical protein